MIPCEQALRILFEYLDGELEDVPAEEVRRHLEICRQCYPRVRFERAFLELLDRVGGGGSVPPALRGRVLATLAREGLAPG